MLTILKLNRSSEAQYSLLDGAPRLIVGQKSQAKQMGQ
jgi:hypothetical protein